MLPAIKGNFKCSSAKCGTCQYLEHHKKEVQAQKGPIPIKHFINCASEFVIYAITCPCGLIYVGRTTRALKVRFWEHRQNIQNSKKNFEALKRCKQKKKIEHAIPKHYRLCHDGKIEGTKIGLEIIPENKNKDVGKRHKKLAEAEMRWIHKLNSLSPGGLNQAFEITAVI